MVLKALEFLSKKGEYSKRIKVPSTKLILLDINMPGMNGWEFLEEYNFLPEDQKGKIVVAMLTTSLSPDDETRAKKYVGDLKNIFVSRSLLRT